MNEEVVKSNLRTIISTFGGVIAGWFAAKGWFTIDQVTGVLNSPVFLALATSIAMGIWGAITHTQKNAVAVVAKIAEDPASPVKGVITTSNAAGQQLANSIPSETVVSAGTQSATKIATASHGATP